MSYPTGMGAVTGSHYNNVAAQMNSYLNHGGSDGPRLHSAHGNIHQFQPTQVMAHASRAAHNGAYIMGVDPIITNDFAGFSRLFMRNLLHR